MNASRRASLALAALGAAITGAAVALGLAWLRLDRQPAPDDAPAEVRPQPRAGVVALLGLAVLVAAGLLGWKAVQDSRQTHAVALALTRGDPARAPDLMRRYGCAGCHTIPGVPGADGRTAPRLDGLRKQVFIAGVARNSGETLVQWIHDPQSLSPRSAMPRTGISEDEARDVAAWLYAR